MSNSIRFLFTISAILFMQACKSKVTSTDNSPSPLPIVSTVHPIIGNIEESKQLNGQVVYLNKTTVSAPIAGYITAVNTALGNRVTAGQVLFKIQTKESKALEKSGITTSNQFGIITVYAGSSGFISSLPITAPGVFVSEGNTLANILKNRDLVIQVNAPFEYTALLKSQKNIRISLANKENLAAVFYKAMPVIDPVSQTQQLLFKLKQFTPLPENLNLNITFSTKKASNSVLLPKEAVLTNETQDQFWVVKLSNTGLAVKIPIQKGLENKDQIEILKPILNSTDQIILKGAYGLPDSTQVKKGTYE